MKVLEIDGEIRYAEIQVIIRGNDDDDDLIQIEYVTPDADDNFGNDAFNVCDLLWHPLAASWVMFK